MGRIMKRRPTGFVSRPTPAGQDGGRTRTGSGARRTALATVSVLIADDDDLVRAMLGDLVRHDSQLSLAGTAVDAIEAIALAKTTAPDVALVDVDMPGGGGCEATRLIRTWSPGTKVVALSGSGSREAVMGMLAAGASGYLLKGAPDEEIIAAIHRGANGLTSLSGEVATQVVNELGVRLERQAKDAEDFEGRIGRVRRAIDGTALTAVFQPIFDLTTGCPMGAEALARFALEPARTPDLWFAEAEEVGLGAELELAALKVALAAIPALPDGVYLSVNASPATAMLPEFTGLFDVVEPTRVVLEVTEHAPVEDYDALHAAVRDLRRLGMRLAIDDTGAGYASLRHIVHLEPDIIKLDLSITRGVESTGSSRALASAMIAFASEIGAVVVAEGVETRQQLEALRELGAGYGQGYFLARPMDLAGALGVLGSCVPATGRRAR